jgi:hypothetical protein
LGFGLGRGFGLGLGFGFGLGFGRTILGAGLRAGVRRFGPGAGFDLGRILRFGRTEIFLRATGLGFSFCFR